MALDRWIGLILLGIFLAYGYAAWFTMDGSLAPFMRRNPIWPSTFPKVLSVLGILCALSIITGLEKGEAKIGDIDYRRLWDYNLGQALMLLTMIIVSAIATGVVWYLVQVVLGIFLRPLPGFLGG